LTRNIYMKTMKTTRSEKSEKNPPTKMHSKGGERDAETALLLLKRHTRRKARPQTEDGSQKTGKRCKGKTCNRLGAGFFKMCILKGIKRRRRKPKSHLQPW